jgi:hypothetical protein
MIPFVSFEETIVVVSISYPGQNGGQSVGSRINMSESEHGIGPCFTE